MEKLILTIITAFVSAGGLGYLNYQILEAQGSLNIEDGSKSQNMWVGILGMMNFGLFLLISNWLSLVTSFFMTIVLSALLFFFLGRKIFELYWCVINHSSNKKDSIEVSDKDPWEYFTTVTKDKKNMMFIFSLDGTLITFGDFQGANNSKDKRQGVRLHTAAKWPYTPNLDTMYQFSEKEEVETYVDINSKLIYFKVPI